MKYQTSVMGKRKMHTICYKCHLVCITYIKDSATNENYNCLKRMCSEVPNSNYNHRCV